MSIELAHGIGTAKAAPSVTAPVVADSGVIFAAGTAPVHTAGGSVNRVIMVNNYEEALAAFGYSDDWKRYTLCEVIHTAFKLYGISPLFLVNVFDPSKHKKTETKEYDVIDNQVHLPYEAIDSSIIIGSLERGSDYEVFYDNGFCIVEFLTDTSGKVEITYDEADPSMVTKDDVIGGKDVVTNIATGMELIDSVYPKYTTVPDILICPGYSHEAEVATVMSAKAENINGLFGATAIIDADTETVRYYQDIPEWKKENGITAGNELVCFPRLSLSGRIYHYSTHLACLISKTDSDPAYGNGSPCESASNKALQADSMVLTDGTEVTLDVQQANFLNKNGVVTALNFINGFVSWGNWMANYPTETDPTNYLYNQVRMFKWVASSVIQTYWPYTDRNMKRRLADAILQGINDWLSGLTQDEKIYGGRVELPESDNVPENLMAGHLTFRIYLGTQPPLAWQQYHIEYDASYIEAAFS